MLEALLKSCWLVECARANVYGKWGAEFDDHYERTDKRSKLVGDALKAASVEPPETLVPGHTAWLSSMVGDSPSSVPLGPGLLQRLAEWTNVYAVGYLRSDPQEFIALGEAELLFPVPPRIVEEHEAFLPPLAMPGGTLVVVLTDLHVGARGADDLLRAAVSEVNELSPSLVVIPGDVTDDGEPEQFRLAKEMLDGLRAPWHAVLGNHDAVRRSTRSGDGAKHFEDAFGVAVEDRVFDVDGVQVALLDSSDPTPWPWPDFDLNRGTFREDAGGVAGGAMSDEQIDAVAARLDANRPTLLILHHELQPFVGFPPVQFGLREADSVSLMSALTAHRMLGVIAGHTHRSALSAVGPSGSVEQLEVPALKDWPFCYTVLGISDGKVEAVVRQLADRDAVATRAQRLAPIQVNYSLPDDGTLRHTFG